MFALLYLCPTLFRSDSEVDGANLVTGPSGVCAETHNAEARLELSVFVGFPVAQHMLMAGIVESRISEVVGGENGPDNDKRGAGELCRARLLGDGRQRAVDDLLIGPAHAIADHDRAIRSVVRCKGTLHIAEIAYREMDDQCRLQAPEFFQRLHFR